MSSRFVETFNGMPVHYIDEGAALEAAAAGWLACEVVALDTEFMRVRTFHPRAALFQVCDGEACYLVDPLAVGDLAPLARLLAAPGVLKVMHSCSEDLEVCERHLGTLPDPLFDTEVGAALILIATTGYHAVCMALERMGVPQVFVVQLLFLYRYVFVLVDEASRMVRARSLRSFQGKGLGMKVFGYMAGHLLLRTMDRAQRIHLAMLCRGFDGTIGPFHALKVRWWEVMFFLGWSALFVFMRLYNVPRFLGTWIQGVIS